MTLTTPGGKSGLGHDLGEEQGAQAGVGGGLEHHGIAHGDGRGDLPGQHQQREVPGDDLPDHADRLVVTQFGFHQLRPTGVIVKVTGQQWHVDVARLADGLAVVHRLEHGQQAVVLLDVPGDGVHVAGTDHTGRLAPAFEGGPGSGHGRIDFLLPGLGGFRQGFSVGRVDAGVGFGILGMHPFVVDEQSKFAPVLVQPGIDGGRGFGGGAVVHGFEDF